jgi:HD-like signal output (HDOD) protein
MIATKPKSDSDALVESSIAQVGEIATLPEVTVKIIQIVENPKSTARDLHDVIRNDPALSARLLKVVNSAFYGLPGQISNIDRAIVLLGLSAVKNIAIAASITHLFNGGTPIEGFNGVQVWRHAIAVGVASRLITAAQGKPSVEETFLAGLIHDLGLLVERQVFGKKIAEVIARQKASPGRFCEIEQQIIGADHQVLGMALAQKWRFPRHLCTTIGYHHRPLELAATNRELPTIIHVADVLAGRADLGFCCTAANETYGEEELNIIHATPADLEAVAAKLADEVAVAESIFSE